MNSTVTGRRVTLRMPSAGLGTHIPRRAATTPRDPSAELNHRERRPKTITAGVGPSTPAATAHSTKTPLQRHPANDEAQLAPPRRPDRPHQPFPAPPQARRPTPRRNGGSS
jgi:hypothetical protein